MVRRAASNRYAWLRLGLFVGGVLIAIAGFYFVNGWLGWPLLILTFIIFNVVARFHRRVDHSITRHLTWLRHRRFSSGGEGSCIFPPPPLQKITPDATPR